MKRHGLHFFNKTAVDLFLGYMSSALTLKYSAMHIKITFSENSDTAGHYVKFMPKQIFRINAIIKFLYGLAARIPGFHPGGPGSTPGMEKKHLFILL